MAADIEFVFDVGSPTSYLAWTQLPGLAERAGAAIRLTPVLLAGLFKSSGNVSPTACPAKVAYIAKDCARFAERFGAPFALNPNSPVDTAMIMRAIVGAQRDGALEDVLAAAFKAMWVDGAKLDDPNVLEDVAESAGVGVAKLAGWISDESVKAHLRQNTEDAAARGAFGAPTFFVGDDMFFGQDRLEWVEAAARA